MILKICSLLLIILFFGCCRDKYGKNAPTEIFQIEEQSGGQFKYEYFVISNPPIDTSLLKAVVDEYNRRTIFIDTIKKYITTREFYLETRCLTRNYKKNEPYPTFTLLFGLLDDFPCASYSGDDPGQQIRYHYFDDGYLMETTHSIYPHDTGYINYSYQFGQKTFGQNKENKFRIKREIFMDVNHL